MDEFAFFGIGFAATAWAVAHLIDSALGVVKHVRYWKGKQ